MDQVNISYHGHACFMLEADGYRTVIDPYKDGMVPGLPELQLEAEAVYCSHEHGDHAYTQAVTIRKSEKSPPYTMEEYLTPHDDKNGTLRGMNWVRIFRFGDLRVAHLGDLGCMPDEALLECLKEVDCLLIPVGGFYTIDPKEAKCVVDAVDPRVCVPMHYRTDSVGFDILAHVDEFTNQFPDTASCDNSFVLTKDACKQILVIHYKP